VPGAGGGACWRPGRGGPPAALGTPWNREIPSAAKSPGGFHPISGNASDIPGMSDYLSGTERASRGGQQVVKPLAHYLTYGANGGRDPSPHFDTDWYVARCPDVEKLGLHPLKC
jgi:hypothetical protein